MSDLLKIMQAKGTENKESTSYGLSVELFLTKTVLLCVSAVNDECQMDIFPGSIIFIPVIVRQRY